MFTVRGAVTAITVAVLVGGVGAWSLLPHAGARTEVTTWGEIQRPTLDGLALGCGPLEIVSAATSDTGWVDTRNVLPYDTVVPTAGWFYPYGPEEAIEAEVAPEQVLREMWEGGSVAWYTAGASSEVRASLERLVAANPQWRMRVAQWPEGRGGQPSGQVAFATWGATQSCDQVSEDVAAAVIAAGSGAPGRPGQVPPSLLEGAELPADWHAPSLGDAQPAPFPDDL